MKALEESAIAAGVSAEALMEEAGEAIAREVLRTFPAPGVCLAVFGRGNNGGDALVAARHLAAAGWQTTLIGAFPGARWGELPRKKFEEAEGCRIGDLASLEQARGRPLIVLDGLLGLGATGPLHDEVAQFAAAINALHQRSNAHVFALDLPTGLNGDSGETDAACVVADTTLAIGFAKKGLLADGATSHAGRLRILPLAELSKRAGEASLGDSVIAPAELRAALPRRAFDSHKGDYGRVGIIAGAPGMLGAAAMCAEACVRAGAGLVTLYATADVAGRLSMMTAPEVMVREVTALDGVPVEAHDALALGPGLGRARGEEIAELVRSAPRPMVVDADGLNCLADRLEALGEAAGERILTPHPGEMARLAPDLMTGSRAEIARGFLRRHPNATLLLKGARTIVAREGQLAYNCTGTPGMATGGMGDVLTGVIAALLGQRLPPFQAAQLGAWLCGRAGELAIDRGGESEESLTPSRLLDWLGAAFRDLREW